ncbi:hypothetical protein E2C01_001778 [Portunus trituberculatus]|uniref:Uncharacterized protein n=1 Tax=Portunus trituberculatus TaxID=210409 RepID=A0A5B7CKC2_PORTR|nr:hypothetical protein [Portunus trituberculatus]
MIFIVHALLFSPLPTVSLSAAKNSATFRESSINVTEAFRVQIDCSSHIVEMCPTTEGVNAVKIIWK